MAQHLPVDDIMHVDEPRHMHEHRIVTPILTSRGSGCARQKESVDGALEARRDIVLALIHRPKRLVVRIRNPRFVSLVDVPDQRQSPLIAFLVRSGHRHRSEIVVGGVSETLKVDGNRSAP